jgi:heterodisulfide reductase subunit A
VGMGPSGGMAELAGRCGITLEDTGFVKPVHDALDTAATLCPGIYVAGTAAAPKDIPDSVASGGAAAMRAYRDAVRFRSPAHDDRGIEASETPEALCAVHDAVRVRSL